MQSLEDFEFFYKKSLADVAKVVEQRRDKVAPHYKRFYKKILILSAITLTIEIILYNTEPPTVTSIFTPMILAMLFIFGSIAIGVRQNSRNKKFIDFFDNKITTTLSSFFFSDWSFNPEIKDQREAMSDCPQFDNRFINEIEGRCFLTKDDMTLQNLTIRSSTPVQNTRDGNTQATSSTREGLLFIKNYPDRDKERWVILPDNMEGQFGKNVTKVVESALQVLKSFDPGMGSRDKVAGKEIVRFDNDDAFEKKFRVYKDEGSVAPGFINSDMRTKLVKLTEAFELPFSLSMSKGKLYFYLPSGAFFSCNEGDVFNDVSTFDYYKRFYEDAQNASKVLETFDKAAEPSLAFE